MRMLINMCRAELNCRGCRQRLVGRVINSLEQEGILLAHACVRWTTITWAFQIWWREIENSREVTVLLKAISLLFWIPYFHTKNVFYDKNRTFSTRVFSCRFFSNRFCWTFKDFNLKDSTPKITVPVQVWFSLAKQCISKVWFPNSWFYLSRKKRIVAMFSCFKKNEKFLQREVYSLVRCLILIWSRRHAFIYATKTWNLWVFLFVCLFFTVFRTFSRRKI